MPEPARWNSGALRLAGVYSTGPSAGPRVRRDMATPGWCAPADCAGEWGAVIRIPVSDDHDCPRTRGAPNQGHSRTPAKGSRCSTWPTLPFGSAASVLPSCCAGQGLALAVFRETAGRSRVFRVFRAVARCRDSPNSFRRNGLLAIENGSTSFGARQAALGPGVRLRRTRVARAARWFRSPSLGPASDRAGQLSYAAGRPRAVLGRLPPPAGQPGLRLDRRLEKCLHVT